jgi:hypothetical protein
VVVEARTREARGYDHQREEQDDGGEMDRARDLVRRDGAQRHQHDGRNQRDAAAVEPQPRHAAERHADIGEDEDGEDQCGHGAPD